MEAACFAHFVQFGSSYFNFNKETNCARQVFGGASSSFCRPSLAVAVGVRTLLSKRLARHTVPPPPNLPNATS